MNELIYQNTYNTINEQLRFLKSLTNNYYGLDEKLIDYCNMLEKTSYVLQRNEKQKKEDQKILDYFGF